MQAATKTLADQLIDWDELLQCMSLVVVPKADKLRRKLVFQVSGDIKAVLIYRIAGVRPPETDRSQSLHQRLALLVWKTFIASRALCGANFVLR